MKLLILDVDGVLTDGTKVYGRDGSPISKSFCDHDFTAIKKFQANGWMVVWLSADTVVNKAVADDRKVPFYYSRDTDGTIDKVKWYHKLVEEYGVDPKDVVYVGDDLLDLPVMQKVVEEGGRSYYPASAVPQFRRLMYKDRPLAGPLDRPGGGGAIMSLFSLYYPLDTTPPAH